MTQKINPKDLLELISKAHKEEIAGYVAGVGAGFFCLYASEKNYATKNDGMLNFFNIK